MDMRQWRRGKGLKFKQLEIERRKIINDGEEQWRIKSRAIWLAVGDEN